MITIFYILGRREDVDNEVIEVCGHVCTNDSSFVSSYWCCCNFSGLRELFFLFIRLKDLIRKMGKPLRFVSFFSTVAARLIKDVSSLYKS